MVESRFSASRKRQLMGLALLFIFVGAWLLANDSLNTATIAVDGPEGEGWKHLAISKWAALSPLLFGGFFLVLGMGLIRLRVILNGLFIRLEPESLSYSWIVTSGRRFHLPRIKTGTIELNKIALIATGDFAPKPFLIAISNSDYLFVDSAVENRKLLEYELKKNISHFQTA